MTVFAQRPYFIGPQLYERIRAASGFTVDTPEGWLAGRVEPIPSADALGDEPAPGAPAEEEPELVEAEPVVASAPIKVGQPMVIPSANDPLLDETFDFYCGVGASRAFQRALVDFCRDAGIDCTVWRFRRRWTVHLTFRVRAAASQVTAFAGFAQVQILQAGPVGPGPLG